MSLTLQTLAEITGAELHGDGETVIEGVNTLADAGPRQLSFLTNSKYRPRLVETAAAAVILSPADLAACPTAALVSDNPHLAYALAAQALFPPVMSPPGVHPGAVIDDTAVVDETAMVGPGCVVGAGSVIGAGVSLGPNCVIGARCVLGEGTRLLASVTLGDDSRLGRRCIIQPGVVIGGDGFGFANDNGHWVKVPQLGGVRIGDDVEIGANTTVDRGAIHDTVIGDGAKVDNLVMIAHNVEVGEDTVIAGCAGISGSTRIGKRCVLAGGVGLVGHIELADGVTVSGMSLVTRSLKQPGVYTGGVPSQPHADWQKNFVHLKRLGDMHRRIRVLEKELAAARSGEPDEQQVK